MISLLVNKSQDDIGVSVVTEGAENLVSAVFNILMSASYNADFRRKDVTNDADQEKVCFFLCEYKIMVWPFIVTPRILKSSLLFKGR